MRPDGDLDTPDHDRDAAPTTAGHGSAGPVIDKASFPDRNPHPVLRILPSGHLAYANAASAPLLPLLGGSVGRSVPADLLARLKEGAATSPSRPVEVAVGHLTYELLPMAAPEPGALNVYGTDVTAARLVERFPDRNPFPVFRLSTDGRLVYANRASVDILAGLGLAVGEALPGELWDRLRQAAQRGDPVTGDAAANQVEVATAGRSWALAPVRIAEFDFINVYGMDVTAMKTVTKFPDQNPNPVLRFSREGRLLYVNPAGELVRQGLGVQVGQELPLDLCRQVQDLAASNRIETMEVVGGDRLYSLLVVPVFEFGFINAYGTDITAVRELERAHADNRRLLLNILPESIVARLRGGEAVIADHVEEMTVLFADVVGFTELSATLAASDVVALLNAIFSAFDALADRHGLEKIKTIGDAYMVCGGLTPGDADHAHRVADMALEMLDFVRGFEAPAGGRVRLRIGLHVGPAVAGVIGMKKFIYDIWGDTVNTASRMESLGQADRIQVCEATAVRLGDRYRFTRRGWIDVKGKGSMETWFLDGPSTTAPTRA